MLRLFAVTTVLLTSSALLVLACAEDAPSLDDGRGDASLPGRDRDGSSSSEEDDSGVSGKGDGGDDGDDGGNKNGDCNGKYVEPDLDAGGPCGTMDFGEPAAPFAAVVDGGAYSGTTLADGVYDAVLAERASAAGGSWRETFVVKGDRFTRVRQVDTGSGLAPVSYRSGSFAYDTSSSPQTIKLTYDCAQSGDSAVDAGSDVLVSDAVEESDCSARYRYGAAGIRITLRRR